MKTVEKWPQPVAKRIIKIEASTARPKVANKLYIILPFPSSPAQGFVINCDADSVGYVLILAGELILCLCSQYAVEVVPE